MATNFATASYQEVVDLHTESKTVSVIGIHTPNTSTPVKMLGGFWKQFRKVRYLGCSLSLVPAARLPADPLQVSIGAGEPTIDPRDMLNPIMFHGCHGDDMGAILDTLYSGEATGTSDVVRKQSDSAVLDVFSENQVGNDYVDALYYRSLTDRTWAKAHPQVGFRKSGLRPLVHQIVANRPFSQFSLDDRSGNLGPSVINSNGIPKSAGQIGVNPTVTDGRLGVYPTPGLPDTNAPETQTNFVIEPDRTGYAFATSGLRPLGWQDTQTSVMTTSQYVSDPLIGNAEQDAQKIANVLKQVVVPNTIPKFYMGMILLPPAYKTEQWFRLQINHTFAFKGFRGISMIDDDAEVINNAPAYSNFQ
ncbi:Cap protein [Porcine stool-associated circular virus 7]|uniref:Cap protein n=1 Tax=Porcine stool-associated circular virus 7 TaxID=1537166 RepID=A0A076VE89_9VIRU|nr:Cap protein [Porcine stool-associated circular virus 7]